MQEICSFAGKEVRILQITKNTIYTRDSIIMHTTCGKKLYGCFIAGPWKGVEYTHNSRKSLVVTLRGHRYRFKLMPRYHLIEAVLAICEKKEEDIAKYRI